jgi:hypothetical protein
MKWLARHWRKLVLIALGAAGAVASKDTIVARYAAPAAQVVKAIPCTPGEADCPPSPAALATPEK